MKRFLLVTVFLLSSCSSLSIKDLTAGPSERSAMLKKSIDSFHSAVYWGDASKASSFVKKDFRKSFIQDMALRKTKEKLVEFEIEDIEFDEQVKSAKVRTRVKFLNKSSYTVSDRLEEESWDYFPNQGAWQNVGLREVRAITADDKTYRSLSSQ